jgi:hypothetical protein
MCLLLALWQRSPLLSAVPGAELASPRETRVTEQVSPRLTSSIELARLVGRSLADVSYGALTFWHVTACQPSICAPSWSLTLTSGVPRSPGVLRLAFFVGVVIWYRPID